jgi:protein TonB
VSQGPTCRHCLALGLLTSALLHGAALYLWSRTAPAAPSTPPLVTINLELTDFADETGTGDGNSATPTEPRPPDPAPADPVSEPPPEPPPPPVRPVEPDPASTPNPARDIEPEPQRVVAPPPPRDPPRPRPTPKPEAKPVPRPQPKPPTPPRPQTRAPLPVDRPPPERPRQAQARPAGPIAGPTRPQGESQAGRPGPSGGPAPRAPASTAGPAAKAAAERAYLAELQRAISGRQRFPEEARRRHKSGVATVAFVVATDGRISQVRIVQSAGDPNLDRAALDALNRLGRFKPIPAVLGRSSWSMRVPIRFDLR